MTDLRHFLHVVRIIILHGVIGLNRINTWLYITDDCEVEVQIPEGRDTSRPTKLLTIPIYRIRIRYVCLRFGIESTGGRGGWRCSYFVDLEPRCGENCQVKNARCHDRQASHSRVFAES